MRHQQKGKKFGFGQDANQALRRKLLVNFMTHGHITTTITKAKYLKIHVDRAVSLAKRATPASHNMLLRAFGDEEMVVMLEKAVGVLSSRESGYTTHERLGRRVNDGTMMVKVSWIESVVLKKPEKASKTPKPAQAKAAASKEVKEVVKKPVVKKPKADKAAK